MLHMLAVLAAATTLPIPSRRLDLQVGGVPALAMAPSLLQLARLHVSSQAALHCTGLFPPAVD